MTAEQCPLARREPAPEIWTGRQVEFLLTAGKINPRIRRDYEQTSAPDAHTGL